jgi:hypothetical protein
MRVFDALSRRLRLAGLAAYELPRLSFADAVRMRRDHSDAARLGVIAWTRSKIGRFTDGGSRSRLRWSPRARLPLMIGPPAPTSSGSDVFNAGARHWSGRTMQSDGTLIGRGTELATIERVVGAAPDGHGGALVVARRPGSGRPRCRPTSRATRRLPCPAGRGVQAEDELAFGGCVSSSGHRSRS